MIKLLIASLVLMSATTSARTTECVPGSVGYSFDHATAVFSGEVTSQEYKDAQEAGLDAWPDKGALVTKFKVERWWKGGSADEVTVYTPAVKRDGRVWILEDDDRFTVGRKYLVYARGSLERLINGGCSRTTELEHAEDDLKALGEGRAPERRDQ